MERVFDSEFIFRSSRSSGPGGQNVNKVSTKIELRFNVLHSILLSEAEKEMLLDKLKSKINNEGVLIIVSQQSRSQLKNKENAVEKLYRLIEKALTPPKERKPTTTPRHIKEKRLEAKQRLSEKKELRKKPT